MCVVMGPALLPSKKTTPEQRKEYVYGRTAIRTNANTANAVIMLTSIFRSRATKDAASHKLHIGGSRRHVVADRAVVSAVGELAA